MPDADEDPRNDAALLDDSSASLVEDGSPLEDLPAYVVSRIAKLQSLDEEREKIMQEYYSERAVLEKRYAERCQGLYETRAQIINGDLDEQIAKEVVMANQQTTEGGEEDSDAKSKPGELSLSSIGDEKLRGVPQFWVVALTSMETIGELVTEEDVDCLHHLKDITCRDDDDGKGFTLSFHFGPNPFFHDTILTKKYEVPNLLASDEPLLKQVEGCKIHWKEDKSLTFRRIKKTQKGKGKNEGQTRVVVKTEKRESFFHWFDPPKMPSMEDMDEDAAQKLEEIFDADYEVAQAFRTQVIPRAVMWFSGEVSYTSYADEHLIVGFCFNRC